jgi:negative regulator of flagellin synthesis FlgM
MKIGSFETKPPVAVGNERTKPVAVPPKPDDSGTQVLLSAAAREITKPPVEAKEGGFDGAKVERISTAIRAGSFKVNPEAIADKLIANAAELLARKPN